MTRLEIETAVRRRRRRKSERAMRWAFGACFARFFIGALWGAALGAFMIVLVMGFSPVGRAPVTPGQPTIPLFWSRAALAQPVAWGVLSLLFFDEVLHVVNGLLGFTQSLGKASGLRTNDMHRRRD